jgi:protein gp37
MSKTTIEWTDETLSILRGCDAVSPGCAHCYAAVMAARFAGPGQPFAGLARRKGAEGRSLAVWTNEPVRQVPDAMLDVLSWRKAKRVFVNSMSDTFHADVPFEFIATWWAIMACSSTVTFQIVTKRARRMREFFEWTTANGGPDHWLRCALNMCDALEHKDARWKKARETLLVRFKAVTTRAELTRKTTLLALENVWLLVSTENQETYDERVAELLQCPAVVRGISAEPLLGPIELGLGCWVRLPNVVTRYDAKNARPITASGVFRAVRSGDTLRIETSAGPIELRSDEYERLPDIDWAIIGGESGAGCRANDLAWTRSILAQIETYNIDRVVDGPGYLAPFLKQLGGAALDREAGLVGRLYPKPTKPARGWIKTRLKDSHGGDEAEFPADLHGHRHFPIPRISQRPESPLPRPAGQLGLVL